jgi:hypothetical protein
MVVLSLDVMDISGEHQSELEHDFTKTRLSKDGLALETLRNGRKSPPGLLIGCILMRSPRWRCRVGEPKQSARLLWIMLRRLGTR